MYSEKIKMTSLQKSTYVTLELNFCLLLNHPPTLSFLYRLSGLIYYVFTVGVNY